jgi:acetylornithine deacetylase/succinyl-diaminopimelate desuccinylase-like protein
VKITRSLILAATIAAPVEGQGVDAILATIKADNAWTLAQQRSICEIPAPPFKETARGLEYKKRFEALGLTARIDAVGNVIAERPGTGKGPTIVLAGHLDTVFPEGTDVKVKDEGGRMKGPGIGDDCRGLAVVLAVAVKKVPATCAASDISSTSSSRARSTTSSR